MQSLSELSGARKTVGRDGLFHYPGLTWPVSRYSIVTVQDEELRSEQMIVATDKLLYRFTGTEEYDMA